MAQNKANERGVRLTMAVPIAANSGVGPKSNDPLLFGRGTCPSFGLAGVAQSSDTPPTGVTTGNVAVDFEGVFFLQVVSKDASNSSVVVAPGDKLYAIGGTYDSATGCLYGFTLRPDATGAYFGNCLDAVAGGLTVTARVRLKVTG